VSRRRALRRDGGVAAAERLFAPRSAKEEKTARERSLRRRQRFATDAPCSSLSKRFLTIVRIRSAAAGPVSTGADESFFRGVEPERRPGHTAAASAAWGGNRSEGPGIPTSR